MSYKVTVQPQVVGFAATLGLQHRRAFKAAILGLANERGEVRALTDRLSGYYRLRVGKFRVIFRYLAPKTIECVFAEERKLVYEIFESEVRRILGGAED